MRKLWAVRLIGAVVIGICVLGVIVTIGPPRQVGSGQCELRVLDQVTGLPVEGAVVSAIWSIRGMEGVVIRFPHVDETLTGEDGVAIFPPWRKMTLTWGAFRDGQPEVRVISRDYLPAVVRSSGCHGEIQLRPAEATSLEERTVAADELMDSLWEFYRGKHCEWVQLPLMVRAAEEAYAPYRPLWLDGSRQPPFNELKNRKVCGEPEVEK